jgi:hypothetical protein
LKWADRRYLPILSKAATSSPALTPKAWPTWDLFWQRFPHVSRCTVWDEIPLSPYSSDANVRNDMQKTIWHGSKATGSQAQMQNKLLLRNTHNCSVEGGPHQKFGDGVFELLAALVLRDLHPTCADHTLMSGHPHFLYPVE